jgi:DNA polymerase/3'-5' exonuclease PolX
MELKKALNTAEEIIEIIKPYCTRIEIAGSTRRVKPVVHDIELVAIPENINTLKNKLGMHLIGLQGTKKSNPFAKAGERYIQFSYKHEQIDLFLASADNWGLIYLIRTGSAEFSAGMLARWKKVSGGGYSENGFLHTKEGEIMITREEMDVFNLCKMDFVEPELRF